MFGIYFKKLKRENKRKQIVLDCEYAFQDAINAVFGADRETLKRMFAREAENAGFVVGGGMLRGK